MRKNEILVYLFVGLSTAACTPQPVDLEAEKSRLMQLSRDWSAIVNSGDIDAVIAHWAEDAIMLPPDAPAIEGKAAIRAYVEAATAIPGFRISWEPEQAFVAAAGDMAYLIERNTITFDGENGEPVAVHGKVVTVWRKDRAGEWKNVVDIWNSLPANGT